jgi:hypothetical protein
MDNPYENEYGPAPKNSCEFSFMISLHSVWKYIKNKIKDSAKFCPYCGSNVSVDDYADGNFKCCNIILKEKENDNEDS